MQIGRHNPIQLYALNGHIAYLKYLWAEERKSEILPVILEGNRLKEQMQHIPPSILVEFQTLSSRFYLYNGQLDMAIHPDTILKEHPAAIESTDFHFYNFEYCNKQNCLNSNFYFFKKR